MFILFIVLQLLATKFSQQREISSSSFLDEANLTVPEIITRHNYSAETHRTVTEDGYILTIHRIPSFKTTKAPILIMHGILASSADWIIMGPEKSLGYVLADEGYDVWLGNARGNRYSRNHTCLNPDRTQFWDFSWHEIGIYDLPAIIDYIIAQTGHQRIFYVGHSQGTTAFFVMCAQRPEYNEKIIAQFSMAPIGFVGHMYSPLMRILAKSEIVLKHVIGPEEFMPRNGVVSLFGQKFCGFSKFVCKNILFAICGYNSKEVNSTVLPLILAHIPAGSSTKQFMHYAQEINSGEFRQYDYGFFGNWKRYKWWKPTKYNLGKITVPIYFFYSNNDWISSSRDVHKLAKKLPNVKGTFLVSDEKFNHMDYLFGVDSNKFIYRKIVSLLTKYRN